MDRYVPLISTATHAMIIDTGARNVVFAVRAGWTKRVCPNRFGKEVAYVLHTESDHESESDRNDRSIGSVYFDIFGIEIPIFFFAGGSWT